MRGFRGQRRSCGYERKRTRLNIILVTGANARARTISVERRHWTAASGKVAAEAHARYGTMVETDHGNGLTTATALITRHTHASKLNVREGIWSYADNASPPWAPRDARPARLADGQFQCLDRVRVLVADHQLTGPLHRREDLELVLGIGERVRRVGRTRPRVSTAHVAERRQPFERVLVEIGRLGIGRAVAGVGDHFFQFSRHVGCDCPTLREQVGRFPGIRGEVVQFRSRRLNELVLG